LLYTSTQEPVPEGWGEDQVALESLSSKLKALSSNFIRNKVIGGPFSRQGI
jgi:hypothetical protein